MYSSYDDLLLTFGHSNTKAWLDIDNDGDVNKMRARAEYFIELATAELNDKLKPTRYGALLPFDPVPVTIRRMATLTTAIRLQDSRGITDVPVDMLLPYKEELQGLWRSLTYGVIELFDAPPETVDYPEVVQTNAAVVTIDALAGLPANPFVRPICRPCRPVCRDEDGNCRVDWW